MNFIILRRCLLLRRENRAIHKILNNINENVLEKNQEKIGKIYKCIFDRKEGNYFVGRTEFDSPDVDNEVLIDASKHYVKTGEFVTVKIIDATEFDLFAEPI